MADWSEGYVTDVGYTLGFYQEFSPVWLATAASLLGYRAPDLSKPYRFAELGCGQGFGLSILAATNPLGQFFGFDFNPSQIAHGQYLAGSAELQNLEFHDLSFQQLAESPEDAWPSFDFITLHGIYSWVNRENQLAIMEFVRRFLKPGGLVYISYNCSPGWASMIPLQRLMRLHAETHPARSDVQGQQAIAFIENLRSSGAAFFNYHSDLASRLETASKLESHYLPHEYLNQAWTIFDFADVVKDCSNAKLSYLGSASLGENLENLSAPANVLPLVQAETNPVMRQTLLDFASNKCFRRDIYQKGLLHLTPQEQLRKIRTIQIASLHREESEQVVFKTPLGEATGQIELYKPVLNALNEKTLTLDEIAKLPALNGKTLGDLIEIALLLFHGGYAHPTVTNESPEFARRINQLISLAVLDGYQYNFLAAPTIGGAIHAGFVEMLTLQVYLEGGTRDQVTFIETAWRILQEKNRTLVKDGHTLTSLESASPELESIWQSWNIKLQSVWTALGILPVD